MTAIHSSDMNRQLSRSSEFTLEARGEAAVSRPIGSEVEALKVPSFHKGVWKK
jgi:hypothetical protein